MKKRVFTFWESKRPMPAYLRLCMQTWKRFIPDIHIEVINHSNLENYVGDIYDTEKLKTFSLPMQSDAVSAAVLEKQGGIFMDVDTIVTKDFFQDFGALEPQKFIGFGQQAIKGLHLAVLKSPPNNRIATLWREAAQERIKNKPASYEWSYMGNAILAPAFEDPFYVTDYLIIDRVLYGNILEAAILETGNAKSDYLNFYFNENINIDEKVAASYARYGIVSLHNSWTPQDYKAIQDESVILNKNVLLSRVLKHCLEAN